MDISNIALRKKHSDSYKFTSINDDAIQGAAAWCSSKSRPFNWDWRQIKQQLLSNQTKCIDVALWENGQLIGLAIGYVKGASILIESLEGMPSDLGQRSRLMPMVLLPFKIFGRKKSKERLNIMYPANMKLANYYALFGGRVITGKHGLMYVTYSI